jgi:deazaflavin-dependent oxidoreductase (nitroreductase family)
MAPLRYVDPSKPRGRIYLAICRLSATRSGMWLASAIAWKLDPVLLKLTGGRLASTGPVACAVLETRGARSGRPRRTATLYFHDGERVTIVAAKQGRSTQPAWYHNIRKHPEVRFGGLPFRASVVDDQDERRRLWQLAVRVFPQFDDFRVEAARAGRTIPIVQLTPR